MQPPMLLPADFPTGEAWFRALFARVSAVNACTHCWHRPAQWSTSLAHQAPQMCCWCGATKGPQHGPYAPEGGR